MAGFECEVRRDLREQNCTLVGNGKGDHEIWYSPITDRHVTVDGKIKSQQTANAIMKQAGIDHRF